MDFSETHKVGQAQQEIQRLQQMVQDLGQERDALQHDLQALDERLQSALSDIGRLGFDLRRAQHDHRLMFYQHEQLKGAHATLVEQRADLLRQLAEGQSEVERLSDACALQDQRCVQADAEIRELSEALLSTTSHAQKAQALAAAQETQAGYWKSACAALTVERDRLLDALADRTAR